MMRKCPDNVGFAIDGIFLMLHLPQTAYLVSPRFINSLALFLRQYLPCRLQVYRRFMTMLFKQMQKIASGQERQWFTLCEFVCVRAIVRCSHQDPFCRSLIHYRSIEIPNGGYTNSIGVALCLDYYLTSTDRSLRGDFFD